MSVREESGGVDKMTTFNSARAFDLSVRDRTVSDSEALLTFDGYRSHMSVGVLERV